MENTNQPQFVQSLEKEYGIGITLSDANMDGEDPYEYYLELSQYYGDTSECDFQNGECDNDGILWQANDFGSPFFCSNHALPQEQLGYQFIASR